LQKVTSTRKSAALASLGVLLAVLLMGCGGDSPAPEKVSDPVTTDADTPADHTDASLEDVDAELECTLPGSLLADLTIQRQLVLNVAVAGGANLNSVQATSPLEPDVFRSTADVLDGLDLSGLQSVPQFDAPEDVVADLRKTADLLEAALAAGDDTSHPAWQELKDFYTPEFFTRHSSSVNYYLSSAGCA